VAKKRGKKRPGLTPAFLHTNRGRMDAIGEWKAKAIVGGLAITWPAPPALTIPGFPLGLLFEVYSNAGRFDPDDRMFELWDVYLAHHAAIRPWVRRREPDEAWVTIGRWSDQNHYELTVVCTKVRGQELYLSAKEFNEATGRFEAVRALN
jgi:hypothetical protein